MKIKYFVPLIILSGFYSSSFAALTWSDDLEASLQKAKEEDKSVIALFHKSGNSDSQLFHQDVLNQDDFLAESRQQLLFTEVDTFPLHKNVTQEYQHKMNLLQIQYKISGDTLLFLHPHNITLAAYRIPFNAKSYKQEPIEEFIKEGLERKKLADNLLAQAQKAQGSQKAALLLKLYESLPKQLERHNLALIFEIIEADPQNEQGVFEEIRPYKEYRDSIAQVLQELEEIALDDRLEHLSLMLERPHYSAKVRYFMYVLQLPYCLSTEDIQHAVAKSQDYFNGLESLTETQKKNVLSIFEAMSTADDQEKVLKELKEMREKRELEEEIDRFYRFFVK